MLGLEDVTELVDNLRGDAVRDEVTLHVVLGLGLQVGLEGLLDEVRLGAVEPQGRGALGVLVGAPQVAQADGLEQVLVLRHTVEAQADVAVLALVDADAAQVLMARTRTRVGDTRVHVVHHVVRAHAQQGLVHRHVDTLALAGDLHAVQGRQRRGDDHQRVDVVTQVGGDVHRLIRGAVLRDDARVGGDRQVVGGRVDLLFIAVLAKAGDMHDDELGVDLPQELIRDALASVHRALAGLDEDVRVLDDGAQSFLAFVGERVHGDRAHVAALHFLDPRGVAHRVAGPHVLDPRDVGAPLAHDGRSRGGCDLNGGVDDLDAIEDAE